MKTIAEFRKISYQIDSFISLSDITKINHGRILEALSIGCGYKNYNHLLKHVSNNEINIGKNGLDIENAFNYLKLEKQRNHDIYTVIKYSIREFWDPNKQSETFTYPGEQMYLAYSKYNIDDGDIIIMYYVLDKFRNKIIQLGNDTQISEGGLLVAIKKLIIDLHIDSNNTFSICAYEDCNFESVIEYVSNSGGIMEFDNVKVAQETSLFDSKLSSAELVDLDPATGKHTLGVPYMDWQWYKLRKKLKEAEPDECGPEHIYLSNQSDKEHPIIMLDYEDEITVCYGEDINSLVDFGLFSMNDMYEQLSNVSMYSWPITLLRALSENETIEEMIYLMDEGQFRMSITLPYNSNKIALNGDWMKYTDKFNEDEPFLFKTLSSNALDEINKLKDDILKLKFNPAKSLHNGI